VPPNLGGARRQADTGRKKPRGNTIETTKKSYKEKFDYGRPGQAKLYEGSFWSMVRKGTSVSRLKGNSGGKS